MRVEVRSLATRPAVSSGFCENAETVLSVIQFCVVTTTSFPSSFATELLYQHSKAT